MNGIRSAVRRAAGRWIISRSLDESSVYHVSMRPLQGTGRNYKFLLLFRNGYTTPQVRCLSRIFHPNISTADGSMYCGWLFSTMNTEQVLEYIYNLLSKPALDYESIRNQQAADMYGNDPEGYLQLFSEY